jgi:hypothetical protein
MAQIGSPSAGWYTDPSGLHGARYWDGASWTEEVRDDLTGPSSNGGTPGTSANPAADTVVGIAEAVAAVAAADLTGSVERGGEPALVVDYGTDAPWGAQPGTNGNGSPLIADPFAAIAPSPFAAAPEPVAPLVADPFAAAPEPAAPLVADPFAAAAPPAFAAAPEPAIPSASPPVVPAAAPIPAPPPAPVPSGPAPGWYPDPAARHQVRLWDGFRWSERVADNGLEGVDPLPGASAAASAGTVDPALGAWSTELAGAVPTAADALPLSAGQMSLASLPPSAGTDLAASDRPRARPTPKVRVAGGFVFGGALALLVGSATTWIEVTGPRVGDEWTATGLDLGDGRITVALALILAVLGAMIITGRMARFGGTKVAAMGALVAGAAALAVTAVDIADVADRAARLGVPEGAVSNVGNGLWAAFLGALFAVAGGLMAFANRE